MAVTVTTDLVTLFTGNVAFGGGTLNESGLQVFGTGCLAVQVSNTTSHFVGNVTSFNLNGRAIYAWMSGPTSIAPIASGGFRIVIGDGTNQRAYFVGGRDVPYFSRGAWGCFVLHSEALPTQFAQLSGSAQPNLSAITQVGVGFTTTAKVTGNSPNCFYDVMRHGTGLTVLGNPSDPGTFEDIVELDNSLSNAWGMIREIDQDVYGCQGRLTFGSNSAASLFEEENTTLLFESRQVPPSFYRITTIGAAAQSNTFRLGEKLGTGEAASGVAGVNILSNRGLELVFNDQNSDNLIYGSTITGATQGISFSSSNSTSELISSTINNGGILNFGDAFTRDNAINNSTLLLTPDTDIARTTFNGANGGHGIQINTAGTYNFENIQFINFGDNETVDAAVFNDSGGEVTINIFGGNSPTVRNGAGSTTIINNPTLFTVVNVIPDSEVRIFRQSDLEELAGVESADIPPIDVNNVTVTADPDNAGRVRVSYSYNHSVDIPIFLVIFKQTQIPIYQPLILTAQDSSFFSTQVFDRQFFVFEE